MTMTQSAPTVKCGNRAAHGGEPGYHFTSSGVRECYASTGRFSAPKDPAFEQAVEVFNGVWHSTGPLAEQGHPEPQCPGESCPVMSLPAVSVQSAVARMRAAQEAKDAEEAAAKRARYAAWRSIPVFTGARAYYALEMGGTVHFFKVSRPKTGKHAGKTFVEERAGDAFHKMAWGRTGDVLDAIAAAPAEAGALYGREIGQCGRCHRTLTDTASRAAGIGPECIKKG